MKRSIIVVCLLLPMFLFSQQTIENPFSNFKDWASVLDSAKKSKKNIFIDAYATWCGPCKKMDGEVYSSPQIASYLKNNFVSVKVQMDKTLNDAQHTKSWYESAENLTEKYNITAYPAYIFLSPNGDLIQLNEGYMDIETFLGTLQEANDPKNSYTRKIAQFQSGEIPAKELLSLALKAKDIKNDNLALLMAKAYKEGYYNKQPVLSVMQPSTPTFIGNFSELFNADDPTFCFFRKYPKQVDSLVHETGFAFRIVEFLISRDVIEPQVQESNLTNTGPHWEKIESQVARKYGTNIASKLVFNRRLGWYYTKKDWQNVVKYELKKIERNGLDTAGIGKNMLNNLIYSVIFIHATDSVDLAKAVEYMQVLLTMEPNKETWLDTYANLLYKAGRKEEAIKTEEKALAISCSKKNVAYQRFYEETIQKMRDNQPTWQQ